MLKAWSPAERGWKLWSGTLLEEVMPLGRSRTPRPSLPLCFPVLKFQSRIPLPWCSASSPAPKRQGAYGTLELIWLKLWAKINISLFLSCFFWIFCQIGGTVYNESNVQGIEKGMGEAPPPLVLPQWGFLFSHFIQWRATTETKFCWAISCLNQACGAGCSNTRWTSLLWF